MSQASDLESRRLREKLNRLDNQPKTKYPTDADGLLRRDLQRQEERARRDEALANLQAEEDAFDVARAEVAARAAQQQFPIAPHLHRDDADVFSVDDMPPLPPAQFIPPPPPIPPPPAFDLNDYAYFRDN